MLPQPTMYPMSCPLGLLADKRSQTDPFHVYKPGVISLPVAPAVAVLYTSRPVAGLETVLPSSVPVNATRGGRNPLSVAATSSLAELCGVVVPMPTWAEALKVNAHTQTANRRADVQLVFMRW